MTYFDLLLVFIVINITNFVFLHSKEKFKKVSLILSGISLIFSTLMIVLINTSYVSLISKEYAQNVAQRNIYFNLMKELNLTFLIVAIIAVIVFLLLSRKFKYKYFYIDTIIILVGLNLALSLFRGIIITKDIIDFSTLSFSLIYYYLNFAIVPLVLKKVSKKE